MKYKISVMGCDDSTHIEMDLAPPSVALVSRIAEAITEASEYNCMPRMHIKPVRLEQDES